jgi:hypothetical protein
MVTAHIIILFYWDSVSGFASRLNAEWKGLQKPGRDPMLFSLQEYLPW